MASCSAYATLSRESDEFNTKHSSQMFCVTGVGLSVSAAYQNDGKRKRRGLDQWDRVSVLLRFYMAGHQLTWCAAKYDQLRIAKTNDTNSSTSDGTGSTIDGVFEGADGWSRAAVGLWVEQAVEGMLDSTGGLRDICWHGYYDSWRSVSPEFREYHPLYYLFHCHQNKSS